MAQNNGTIGFEDKLWKAADKLRNNMDAAEYKHVVLGLIFLKYISDKFSDIYMRLQNEEHADPEDPEEYKAENAFWVPKEARWEFLQSKAKLPEIGKIIDTAMDLIEAENQPLKGVLPKDYNRPALDKKRLGEVIDLIGTIGMSEENGQDVLGRVYEYFLGQFASAEGKKGGQFYTPESIVKTLVYMLRPFKGRVYDPCCGSGGMFVQSEKFVEAHSGRIDDIYVYGQESNPTTWKLCNMNLAIRGIEANVKLGDTFHNDAHKDLKADFIIANPPFNISDWGGEHLQDDVRWKFGVPPTGNANFAWMQHMIHHLTPQGVMGTVLANGSMSSGTGGEGEIRRKMVEAGLLDCMVALPSQLFYNTMIPACLWFLRRGKTKRQGEVLFIDARNMGEMISRSNRALTHEEILKISDTYHAWRGEKTEQDNFGKYEDTAGFCQSVPISEIEKHGFVLTPGRYVGIPDEEDDGIPFEDKMNELTSQLKEQMEEGLKLDKEIKKNLEGIGFKV
ncbi:type I restriction-modification system subunit M [Patescibacteria group bacterium]|nr:type I restriction-modification system subunit M [Patescibacteria group bacterium]